MHNGALEYIRVSARLLTRLWLTISTPRLWRSAFAEWRARRLSIVAGTPSSSHLGLLSPILSRGEPDICPSPPLHLLHRLSSLDDSAPDICLPLERSSSQLWYTGHSVCRLILLKHGAPDTCLTLHVRKGVPRRLLFFAVLTLVVSKHRVSRAPFSLLRDAVRADPLLRSYPEPPRERHL
jgi:hypothetical protein